jgi:Peptidase M15
MITPTSLISMFKKDFDQLDSVTQELYTKNATKLTARVSELVSRWGGKEPQMTSGWRPKSYNARIGGSTNSKHCSCEAIDLWDPDMSFGKWCFENQAVLKEIGLYMEALTTTHKSDQPSKRWLHLQSSPPRSNSTVFNP